MLALRQFAISWLAGAVTLVAGLAVTSPADFTPPDVIFLLLSFTAVTGVAFLGIAWPVARRLSAGEAWLFIGAASVMGAVASVSHRSA